METNPSVGTSDRWSVRHELDPFRKSSIVFQAPVGKTLKDIADLLENDVTIFIDGEEIPPESWKMIKPKAGMLIVFKSLPGDPLTVASVAIAAGGASLNTYLVTTLGWNAFGAALVSAAATFGAQALATSLFAPDPNNDPFSEERSVTLRATSNRIRRFQMMPEVLGVHRFNPVFAATPWTEPIGDDHYLRMLFALGTGPVAVSDVKIGNTPLSQYRDVEIEYDLSGSGRDLKLFPSQVRQEDLNINLTTSWTTIRTEIETDQIGITLKFPQGLYRSYSDKKGSGVASRSVTIEAEFRKVGETKWNPAFREKITDTTQQLKLWGWLIRGPIVDWAVTPAKCRMVKETHWPGDGDGPQTRMVERCSEEVRTPIFGKLEGGAQYEIRIRRTNDETTATNERDAVFLSAMRSIKLENPVDAPGTALMAIRIKATDQLNGPVNELNMIVSKLIPTWNGHIWTGLNATTNPAAIYRHVLTGSSNVKKLSLDRVDDDALKDWFNFCEERGLEYSRPIESEIPIRKLLKEIANAGFAEPHLNGDKWSVVIDRTRTHSVQMFTPRNSWNFKGGIPLTEIPEGLRVQFVNRDRDWLEDELTIFDDGITQSDKLELVRFPGVVTADQAMKLGRHFLATMKLRPESFSITVDFENLICTRGDLVEFAHDVPLIGQSQGRNFRGEGDWKWSD